MSKSHTVRAGDTLAAIATKYMSSASAWTQIRDANPILSNRKKASDGSPVIYPGDVLIIPENVSVPANVVSHVPHVLDTDSDQDISILINGKLYTGFTGYRLQFNTDTLDAFSFSAPWDDDDPALHEAFKPFRFSRCSVYYDRNLVFAGTLLSSAPEVSPDSRTITIQGYPVCGVLNDVCLPSTKFPPSYNGMNLQQIADDCCGPFGITTDFSTTPGESFESVEYEPGKKIFEFLKGLAEQRGFIFTNTPAGMLKFWIPPVEPVTATFKEGDAPFISCKPSFSAQNMYSHITGYTKTDAENDSASFTYENKYLIKAGIFRPTSFVSSDGNQASIEAEVMAKAGRMYASCMSYQITVHGHKDRNGNLYRKNMSVSVYAPGAMIYRETKFQVDKVELVRSDSEGNQAVLSLILPGSRYGQIPEVLPWEE